MTEERMKKYLATANTTLPAGWRIEETSRITTRKAPTFSLWLIVEGSMESRHSWPIVIDQPRHILRRIVNAVEEQGLSALLDPEYATHTSRIREAGYGYETLGLREHVLALDPQFSAVIDSIPLQTANE